MDDKVLELMFQSTTYNKIATEECLTNFYKYKGFNIFKASEYAENNRLNFVEFLNNSILSSKALNVPYVFSAASKEVITLDNSYYLVKKIHQQLLKMNWRDFEIISSTILEYCFGAIEVRTTSATADGGLDFEGKLPVKSLKSADIYGYIEVFGQSKKYIGNVGIYDIKSFVAFANTRKRDYVHPPQVFIFFTSSDYASNARKELDVNGFIGLSGFQLANLVFKYKEILTIISPILKAIIDN